jgi:hypothetical protein
VAQGEGPEFKPVLKKNNTKKPNSLKKSFLPDLCNYGIQLGLPTIPICLGLWGKKIFYSKIDKVHQVGLKMGATHFS